MTALNAAGCSVPLTPERPTTERHTMTTNAPTTPEAASKSDNYTIAATNDEGATVIIAQVTHRDISDPAPIRLEKPCECGTTVVWWQGDTDVDCEGCGAAYNGQGQRLRDDWRGNPSTYDDEVSDLEGYEIQHANDH